MPKPKCFRPICYADAVWMPVLRFPTLRKTEDDQWVETDMPTYVLLRRVCDKHRNDYTWHHTGFSKGDFEAMRDVADSRGMRISPPTLLQVQFKPLDWHPRMGYMELDRTQPYDIACNGTCPCPKCGERALWSPSQLTHACADYVNCGIGFKNHTRNDWRLNGYANPHT